jgi:hypothetical protein
MFLESLEKSLFQMVSKDFISLQKMKAYKGVEL